MRIAIGCVVLGALAGAAVAGEESRRVEVHLFGGQIEDGAPLAAWYRDIGVTDVWLYTLQGAFPQDQAPETQRSVKDLVEGGTLEAYAREGLRCWWFERPVPDVMYVRNKGADFPRTHAFDDSAESDAAWAEVCAKIAAIYPEARAAGFQGVVYDNEAYYSFEGDEKGRERPWVWGGHDDQYGPHGNYYRRGRQVGAAICRAWPGARVIMVYAFGYRGEYWWHKGFWDSGVELCLADEHTYGAGPQEEGMQWYQHWWQGRRTVESLDWKRETFDFIPGNRHMMAGLFPIEFTQRTPNYRAEYFRQQLHSAAYDDPSGPVAVWIWPQGPFTPEAWRAVQYAEGDSMEAYLDALRRYSRGARKPTDTRDPSP